MPLTNSSARRFAISVDREEVVDFVQSIGYFEEIFYDLGFEKVGAYRFRYKDEECALIANLESSTDGYEVWVTVQAPDNHAYRLREIAEAMNGFVLDNRHTANHTR